MRKLTALVFAVALVLGGTSMAFAQATYTFDTVRSAGAHEIWPNQANSPNTFEADGGLLGRVVTTAGGATPVLNPAVANACELAPSFDCSGTTPPVFLLPAGAAEGPAGAGGGSECNRVVNACNAAPIPSGGHGGHLNETEGSYSYLVIHTPSQGTNPAGKGIGFFTGSYQIVQQPYLCNDCPVGGAGKDIDNQLAMDNTGPGSVAQSTNVTLWLSQSTAPFGHALVSLQSAGPGKLSPCGSGIVFQDLTTDLCVDGLQGGVGNFLIPAQKVVARNYSVNLANHSAFGANSGLCNAPDCYVENVIIPAALTQNAGTLNVQTQSATSVLPSTAPGSLANATVDSLLFFLTTQQLDMDGDGTEDRIDPCPNDPANGCLFNVLTSSACPAGTVFCNDLAGTPGCYSASLCETRRDVDQNCFVDGGDLNTVQNTLFFNNPFPIGPFDP
ncbi:MAG: hypothetical protein Q8R92_17425 [Deltaproteobacteria bacterium]|nr:hypothetical protein [Deltaproteobacteria bacterium]